LLIWGEQDRIIPVAHGYAAHDAVPGSRLEVLAGVGHFPHVESPTAVVDILDDFIARRDGMSICRIENPAFAPQERPADQALRPTAM
jgi:hypothetical protein